MTSNITHLKKIKVNHFRGLKNIEINIGQRITAICGKNGTSKSTILGMIAQIFSFDTDYTTKEKLNYKTLAGKSFKSDFAEHFRFSAVHDLPGSMDVEYELYDAYFEQNINSLKLGLYKSSDRTKARPVVRGNIVNEVATNSSRNVTHPVIYLSLKRLMPIAQREKYLLKEDLDYLKIIGPEFARENNKLLGKSGGKNLSGTTGTIDSIVVHNDSYDHESVSVGEDNTGQLLMALYSFKKLKEEYPNYHGGILLIDELDAGLFPGAQTELISTLESFSKKYNLQIIFTTHSPIIIQSIFEKSQLDLKNYKTVYMTDTYGEVEVVENYSWSKIYADLFIDTVEFEPEKKIPKINLYFEDGEAYEFFRMLVRDRKVNKLLNPMKDITLGCKTYLSLINHKIPEFCRNSIIIFDGDEENGSKYFNTLKLPTSLPPDQLLFDFLYKLPNDDEFWKNSIGFTRPVFLKAASPILDFLNLEHFPDEQYDLIKIVNQKRKSSKDDLGKTREKFKAFYKNNDIQRLIKGKIAENPFKVMIKSEPEKFSSFENELKSVILKVIDKTHPLMKISVAEFLN
ncbi:AAA family ATPase [Acinetobacter baumannii]|uniref:AAA family ATPase n=1 Tax=Acinetobacter baumannii TaxID=470 RepID=UPI000BF36D0A|nr:AAA family ATPase [Acinetobacter baumannii]EKV0070187.1 AAA family ATPase [Acinetobacter baumannii]MCF1300250.1 AAA family ATPase [Acinetobacter baumannii]MDV7500492.1 AAA family ATPase [Acinetobacter baumannii]HEM8242527.1 AAA family ATPase [Acinetobacter baumannii]